MKKAYFQPSVDIQIVETSSVICASATPSPGPMPSYTPMSKGAALGSEKIIGD